MVRLLYIHPGLGPPPPSAEEDRFYFLSRVCHGDVLLPVWWRSAEEVRADVGAYPELQRGQFTYHMLPVGQWQGPARTAAMMLFFLRKGYWLSRRRGPYDVVMAYGTNSTGIAAAMLSSITGSKLVAEIPGVPEDAYQFGLPKRTLGNQVRRLAADWALQRVVRRADRAQLRYPTQLDAYPSLARVPMSTFPGFVPVSGLNPRAPDGRYVLSMGFPWFTKGIDLLIRAFRKVEGEVPDYRLRIIGHFPDRRHLDELANGCDRIEILPPVSYREALAAISSCSLFVLPSRTEAMARVLLEAMAAGKPIVASRVGGIPHYVRHGENGLLVNAGSVDDLSARIVEVLRDRSLARRLGARGRELIEQGLDELGYVRSFARMLTDMDLQVEETVRQ
jgi:glycosyltransferase involved in cell wall biosynthesis